MNLEEALEAIQRVRYLHWNTNGKCNACTWVTKFGDEVNVVYPCDTIQALDGEQ